jgi:hypothetical protein
MSDRPKYLRLEPGEVYTVALRYLYPTRAKGYAGEAQYRWILTDGRALYTPLDFSDRIKELGIVAGQKFEVERVSGGRVRAYHLPDFCGRPSQAALLLEASSELSEPSESLQVSRKADQSVPQMNDTCELEQSLTAALGASVIAERYAASKAYKLRFAPSDIREMGIALYRIKKQGAG